MANRHWFQRGAAAAAALLMALGMTACGGKDSSSGDASKDDGQTGVNFGGATLKVSIWSDGTIPKLGNSEAGDAAYYALEQAKKKYNCEIEWVILPESQYFDEFVQSALSGLHLFPHRPAALQQHPQLDQAGAGGAHRRFHR